MSILKGTIDTYIISNDDVIDLTNATFIYLHNDASTKVTINGNFVINPAEKHKIEFGFANNKQRWSVSFGSATGTKKLFVMIGRAKSKCSCN